jgi:Zn-dependent protease with chaperone function
VRVPAVTRRDALISRGEFHRRATLLAISALLLLGTSPVYAHHLFAYGAAPLLAGVDHLGYLCLTALHLLLLPVHRVFHVIMVVGVLYAVWDRLRAWSSARRTLAGVVWSVPGIGDPFWRASLAANVRPQLVRVARGSPNPAFTAGLLVPVIYLAEELRERLTEDQLVAVIAHEGAHVTRRDPLRHFLLRLLGCALFWMPTLRRLADDVRDEAEVRADEVAASGRPLVLASAILALATWKTNPTPAIAVGFQRDELLEARIRRLAGEPVTTHSHVTRRSLVSAAFLLGLVWSSGIVMAHPLPESLNNVAAPHHAVERHHCEHDEGLALKHLFCLGRPFSGSRHHPCPHSETVDAR